MLQFTVTVLDNMMSPLQCSPFLLDLLGALTRSKAAFLLPDTLSMRS